MATREIGGGGRPSAPRPLNSADIRRIVDDARRLAECASEAVQHIAVTAGLAVDESQRRIARSKRLAERVRVGMAKPAKRD